MGNFRVILLALLSITIAGGGCFVDFTAPASDDNDAGLGPDAAPGCGDGVLDSNEVCDGTDLGGETCEGLGYESGVLGCDGFCVLNESGCQAFAVCGDGVVDATEVCDDGNSRDWDGCTQCGISEFLVNSETAGNQGEPALIPVGEGFVAVWSGDGAGAGERRVWGQRFDSFATADGAPFLVSAAAAVNGEVNRAPAAARLADGSFVVAWIREGAGEQRVVGRLFDSLSVPIGTIFDVGDLAPNADDSPAVASTPNGGFVVAWIAFEAGFLRAYTRRFDFDAVPLGASVRADGAGGFDPADPRVAAATDGRFLVVWTDQDTAGRLYVRARHFLAAGAVGGVVFDVPADVAGWHSTPDVAATPDGGYVVVWEGLLDPVNGSWDIFARRFDAEVAPLEVDRLVNTQGASDQLRPAVSAGPDGLLVAWETQVGADWDLAARVLDFQGGMSTVELSTHVYQNGWQTSAAVTTTVPGNYIVAWQSDLQDGSLWGVYAQRFTTDGTALGVGP